MRLEIFVALYFIVYPNRISCQPVTDSIRDTRQTNFEECCPCSRDDGTDFREPDMSPNSPMGSFTQEDDCPCRFSGIDSQGSPSIFRPFILRNSHPSEREQQLKQKPLLQPEVGLASSVLETIQKATDEEYQEALEREASRSLVEIEPDFLDSEPDNSRNSVTIVLSPREDFFDTDDAKPEASHVHETRCIHSPLGRSSLSSNDLVPRMSNQRFYLKQKPLRLSSKSLFDMDNSASNVKETFAVNNNDLSTKLRMNPLLLNNLPIKTVSDPTSKINSGYELRKIIPERSNVLKNNELDSPKLRLAALKSRLRDLVEMRNINRMNNIPVPLRQNNLDIFSNKGETGKIVPFDTNSPLDPLFDNASPVLKNILKLKDVELLPPNELFRKHPSDKKLKLSDLNVAGSENDVKISDINEDTIETSVDTRKNSDSEENLLKEPTEKEEKSTKNVLVNSDEIHCSEKENSKDVLIEEMQRRLDDCLKSARRAQDEVNKNSATGLKDTIDSFKYDSKEADDESEMEDSIAETSDNMNEQISNEEGVSITDKVDSSSLQQSTGGRNDEHDSLYEQGNNGLATFKNDILRKLENIKKSIKSKLQDSDPVNEKGTKNQDVSNLDVNSEGDQNKDVTLIPQPTNEKDVTVPDLQNLSDSLLQQENKLKANTRRLPIEDETNLEYNENEDNEPSIDLTNDEKSASSEIDPIETEENQTSEDDDPISKETSFNNNEENNDPESSKYTYDKIDNDNDDLNNDNTLPEDSETNEMSSQASNSKYNAIIAPLSDKLGPTLQDTFSLFKTPIQIPSLEEIRQGITDIIDAGQKESEDFQTELDPLNESSNRNSVLSNPLQSSLPKLNYLGKPLTDRYLRPFQNTRYNIGGNKNLLDTASLNPLITEPFGYPSTLSSYALASDRPNKNIKASEAPNIPSLDDITRFFQSQNHLKSAINNLPKTNLLKNSHFIPHKINSLADDLKYRLDTKPEFKQANRGNQILAKPRLEANDFLQSMSRRHEDVKEKLQALHLDFNDRLASMYKRLNEQKLQSVNTPTFEAKENRLALPKSASKKEKFSPNSNSNSLAKLDNSFLPQPQTLQDTLMRKKPTPKSNSILSKNPLRNYNINPKANTAPLIEREHFNKNPNLSERHKISTKKQKTFKPISKVKISFTTPKPLLASGPKLQKANPIKMPSRLSEKDRTADINNNLKDISKALRSRFQLLGDSNHAPSELIETKQLHEDSTNSQFSPMSVNNGPRINYKQADSEIAPNLKETQETSTNSVPKKTESLLISNLREALKARLQNITNTHTKMSKNPVESTNLREDDAMVSPSILKTSVLNNPLIENTSYKCTMVCSKDS